MINRILFQKYQTFSREVIFSPSSECAGYEMRDDHIISGIFVLRAGISHRKKMLQSSHR
jgi:hypothetical protein